MKSISKLVRGLVYGQAKFQANARIGYQDWSLVYDQVRDQTNAQVYSQILSRVLTKCDEACL